LRKIALFFKKKMGRSKAANDKIALEVNLIKTKLRIMLEKGIVPKLKSNCKIEDDVMWMQCERCQEWFERTTEYFGTSGKKNEFRRMSCWRRIFKDMEIRVKDVATDYKMKEVKIRIHLFVP
jgi:hypothetical protein